MTILLRNITDLREEVGDFSEIIFFLKNIDFLVVRNLL